jgi:hypothetical protein
MTKRNLCALWLGAIMLSGTIILVAGCGEPEEVANEAAFAATRQLGILYEAMSYESQQAYVCDPAEIIPVAQNVAQDYEWVEIDPADVRIGKWDENTSSFVQTLNQPNSVKVVARRIPDGITAEATAALTGLGTSGPAGLELPVGISAFFFGGYGCNDWIKCSPTNDPDSCAGWTSWDYGANDVTVRRILDEVEGYESPGMVAGEDTANFIGGDLTASTFDAMLSLFRRKGYDYDPATGLPIQVNGDGQPVPGHLGEAGVPLYAEDGVTRLLYPDGTVRNYHKWETLVIVYDWYDCSNPNTAIMIAGFATIVLTDVLGPPDKLLRGQILCEVGRGPSGGPDFGTKGSIPILVR